MKKATLEIYGKNLKESLVESLWDFQGEEYTVCYQMEGGYVFMFDQFKRSLENYAFNVIVDYSNMNETGDQITIQCYVLGEKNRHELNLLNLGKSTIRDFRAHLFGYSKRKNCNWQIGEIEFL